MSKKVDNHYLRERKLKSGKLSILIEIRQDGQTFRQSLKVDDYGGLSQCYKVARKIRDKKLVEMREGRYIEHAPTVSELYEEKFRYMTVRVSTKAEQDLYYQKGISAYADTPIDKITSADIQESVNKYAVNHTYKQTKYVLTIWKQIFQCCAMKGMPVVDRTFGVKINRQLCKKQKTRKKKIAKSDFDEFCKKMLDIYAYDSSLLYRSKAVYFALQLMAQCGLQPAETYALERSDFHLYDDMPYIEISKCTGTDFYNPDDANVTDDTVIRNPKTEFRNRIIPITEEIVDLCETILEWSQYDHVFADYDGSLLSTRTVCNLIADVSKKSGIRFNQYMLRHNFSSDLFAQGVNPAVIRDLMGHSSSSTAQTLDYAKTTDAEKAQAMKHRYMA